MKYINKIYTNSKRKDLVIFLFVLSLVVFCNVIIVSFAYFFNSQELSGTIKLGEVDFSFIEESQTNMMVLPNIVVPKTINVGNFRNGNRQDFKSLASIFLRFKVIVLLNEQQNNELTKYINIFSNEKFFYDGQYYYFCDKINAGETINLCDYFSFENHVDNKYQQKQIKLQFSVDAVQAEHGAYKEVWQNYPAEWEDIILNI